MKPLTRRFATTRNRSTILVTSAAALLGVLFFSPISYAATQFWDVNGAVAGSGGTGFWDLVTNNWANTGTGLAVTAPWVNGNDAVFQGVAGIVSNNVAVTVKNMTINTTGYSFDGNFSVLTFAPGAVITVTNAGDSATMTTVTGGTSGLTIAGPGTLNFAGTGQNAYTGTTTVNGGTVNLNKSLSNQTIPGNLTIAGGIVNLVQSNQIANASVVTVQTGGTFAIGAQSDTVGGVSLTGGAITGTTGVLTSTTDFDLQSGSSSAILGGAVNLIKTTTGTVSLSAANVYAGSTSVLLGTLNLNVANALPTGTILNVGAAAGSASTTVVNLNGNNQSVGGINFTEGNVANPAINLGGATLTLTGNVNLAQNTTAPGTGGSANINFGGGGGALDLGGAVRTFNIASTGNYGANGDLQIGAVIQNGGITLNQTATGGGASNTPATLELLSANTYAGLTTINSGVLRAANDAALGTTAAGTVVNAGGTLQIGGAFAGTVNIGAEALTINGVGAALGTLGGTLGALATNGGTQSYAGAITAASNATISANGGTLTLTGGITKTGVNLTLGGTTATNAFGTINVNTVGISGNNGLYNSDLIVDSVTANLNVANSYVGNTFIRTSAGSATINANVSSALPNSADLNINNRTTVKFNDTGATAGRTAVLNIAGSTNQAAQFLQTFQTAGSNFSTVNLGLGSTLTIGNGVNASGTLTPNAQGNATFAGVITGGPNTFLIKDGSNTQILTGNNTITGQIRVQSGTLQIGDGATANASIGAAVLVVVDAAVPGGAGVGTLAVNLTNGSTFTNNVTDNGVVSSLISAGTQTFSGVISGAGVFNHIGAGTTILTAIDTYTGATNVNAGTLQIGNGGNLTGTSGVNVAAAAALNTNLSPGATFDRNVNLIAANSTLNAINSVGTNTLSGIISGAGVVNKNNAGATIVTGTNTYTGLTSVNGGILEVGNNSALGGTVAGTTVAAGGTLRLQSGIVVGAEALTLNGTGAGGIGALTQTIGGISTYGGNIKVATSSTINSNLGVLTLTGSIDKSDVNLTLTGGGTINVNGAITGNAVGFNDDLIINGVTANLNAANSYLGPTFITSIVAGDGIVNANVANALPTLFGRTSITMDATGAGSSKLNLNASQSIASLAGASTSSVTLGGNSLTIGFGTGLNTNGTAAANFAGVISGTGALIKDDTSTQTLSGLNTYFGITTINGGVLVAAQGTILPGATTGNSALGFGDRTVAQGTVVNGPGILRLASGVSITNEFLTLNNGGTLQGPGTFTGPILISPLSSGKVDAFGGTMTLGTIDKTDSDLTFTDSLNSAPGVAVINANGAITTTNPDAAFDDDMFVTGVTANFNAANNYFGPTIISSTNTVGGNGNGILNANVADALPTANGRTSITMDASGTGGSTLGLGANQSIASLAGMGGLLTPSQVTLGGNTLTIGYGTGLNTGGTANADFAGVISGTGALIKDDASRQVLSGASTYNGTTLVQGGILVVGHDPLSLPTFDTGPFDTGLGAADNTAANGTTVNNGTTLELNNSHVGNERLVLNGFGTTGSNGALTNTLGTISSWAGNIVIATNSLINANGGTMTLGAPLNPGSGSIDKTDVDLTFGNSAPGVGVFNIYDSITGDADTGEFNDDLIVNGATVNLFAANTYTGPTTIDSTASSGLVGGGNGILSASAVNALPTAFGRTTIAMDMNGSGTGGSLLNINVSQAIASLENGVDRPNGIFGDPNSNVDIDLGQTLTIGFGLGNDVNGTNNADFSGVISGMGGLTKDETSTVILSGVNTYTGTTSVDNGRLYVNGSIASVGTFVTRDVPLGAVGYLGGIGTINGNLTNSGIVNPGDLNLVNNSAPTIGTLTVNGGNYTQTATGVLAIDITPPGLPGQLPPQFDVLKVNGNGSLAGTVELAPTSLDSPLVDGGHVVVDTNGTLTGLFDTIKVTLAGTDTSPFFANLGNNPADSDPSNDNLPIIRGFITQVNNGQDLSLNIEHAYQDYATTPNQAAAGEMLNELANRLPTDADYDSNVADFLAALDYSDASVVKAALAGLDPSQYFATASALANNNYRLHRAVETHNAAVRAASGSTMSSTSGSYSGKGGVVMSAPAASCGSTNVWGSASYDWQDFNSENGDFDSDGETGSFTAGVDFTIANNFRLGLVAEGSRSSWDGNDSGNGTDIDSYRFGIYANYGEATGWFVDALVGYNSHSIDQDRFVGLGGIGGPDSFSSNYDADGWQGFINVGRAFDTSAGLISPFIGLEWQSLSVDGISDDGILPIGLAGYDVNSLRGLAGIKWEMTLGGSATLYASAAYAHEFEDSANDVSVSFGGGSYDAQGLDQGDSVLLSAGLRWSVTECTTIDFGYRGELSLDDNGLDSHGANVGVNFAF